MLRRLPTVLALLLALLVVAAVPAPAAANEEGPKNILEPRLDLTIWTIVVFSVLLFVLKKVAWKPMLEGLQGREARLRGALDEAHTARSEAQKLLEKHQAEMNKVHDQIRELMDEARREGQQAKDQMIAEARADIQAERDRSFREIEREAEQMKQELWNQAAQLATLVSAKALGRSISEDDHRRLVDEAVAEMGKPSRTTA